MTEPTTLQPPSAEVRAQALARFDALAKPLGSLGRLEELGAWVAACQGTCPPRRLERVTAIVPAGDHGVVASGVAAYPKEITAAMVRTLVAGVAGMSVLAAQHGVPVRVLDIAVDDDLEGVPAEVTAHKIRRSSQPIDSQDAITVEELDEALTAGAAVVAEEVAAGTQLLVMGDLGIGNTSPAAALIASTLGLQADQVTGRGAGLDDEGLARKTAVIQQALDRTAHLSDPRARLAALGSADLAFAVGVMVAAARAGVPVLLDGVISVAEALVAESLEPGAREWFAAGHRSPEPAQAVALESLGLVPVIDLGMRLGEGSGAMTALPILRSAVIALHDMALLADLMAPESVSEPAPAP
ncbi:nicotinate-nucleotide--dimethylbenzimidazole phosphoribosyltransferase [Nostocoides sp. HKS02]|uniref:nicotinate-nucleotide--dimethylbenzimidazole phosphoribosyltransferase n=1 Tax=Nostocoides sp. HKS02 TaxID=1813880 RepID=UPI0012B4551C|nr:nicotinate-nucleotide--dimethylbenzimidazole phosphoribosyltransferase [Tetrasphaera sp. HKS02]QGN58139.1 nicotinate-nucleotide--dimethylbenzimidazole phosphoribosyltransferase [Tetrasphaera sp. HKS02]